MVLELSLRGIVYPALYVYWCTPVLVINIKFTPLDFDIFNNEVLENVMFLHHSHFQQQ